MSTHDELRELVELHALDALDADESELVERHLDGCAPCRSRLDEVRGTVAQLVPDDPRLDVAAVADDRLWSRIEQALPRPDEDDTRGDEAPTGAGAVVDLDTRRRRWSGRLTLAVAAVAATVLVVAATVAALRDEPSDLPQVAASVFESPSAEVVDLVDSDGRPVARVAIADDGEAYVDLGELPRLEADQTYQLWHVEGSEEPVSLGLIGDGSNEVAGFRLGPGADAVAISVEPATGVVAATGPVVASAEL